MLEFQPIEIKDKPIIEKYLNYEPYCGSDGSFANLFLWQHLYHTKYCISDDLLFISGGTDGELGFMCPFGKGDLKKGFEKIAEYATQFSQTPFIDGVTEELREKMDRTCPDLFRYEENRDDSDYIYLSEDLANLEGKKYHAKRNHITKFMDEYYGRYRFEAIASKNIDQVLEFEKRWFEIHMEQEQDLHLEEELIAIQLMLENFTALNARGGVLFADGQVIAYTMGTPGAKDLFVVQFEKADHDIPGAYPTINKLFSTDCLDFKYLNREDDMGLQNLRKAKLSYHPYKLLIKYNGYWKNDTAGK